MNWGGRRGDRGKSGCKQWRNWAKECPQKMPSPCQAFQNTDKNSCHRRRDFPLWTIAWEISFSKLPSCYTIPKWPTPVTGRHTWTGSLCHLNLWQHCVLLTRDPANLAPLGLIPLQGVDPQTYYNGTPGWAVKTTLIIIHLKDPNLYPHKRPGWG